MKIKNYRSKFKVLRSVILSVSEGYNYYIATTLAYILQSPPTGGSFRMTVMVLFVFFFLFPLPFTLKSVYAGHPWGTEGWYCDGNSIWHDVAGDYPPYGHILREDCSADEQCVPVPPPVGTHYTQDARCVPIGFLPGGDDTKIYVDPNPVDEGKDVKVTITSKKYCYDKITVVQSNPTASSLKSEGAFRECKIIHEECQPDTIDIQVEVIDYDSEGNIVGSHSETQTVSAEPYWRTPVGDNKQCWKEISCRAEGVGEFNIYLSTDTQSCNSITKVNITAPASCRQGSSNPQKTTDQSNPPKEIVAQSLHDDQRNTELIAQATLPNELNQDLLSIKGAPTPDTGVETGFFGSLRKIACDFFRVPLLSLGLRLCPKEVRFEAGQTEYFAKQSQALAKSERPSQIQPRPATQECSIQDYIIKNSNQVTEGNKRIDEIDSSLGVGQGVYSLDTPEFSDLSLNKLENLNTDGLIFDQDERVPDINERCRLYNNSNFPGGIDVCKK